MQFLARPIEGRYKLNEFTTEYGNIILDGSETGGISQCNIFEIAFRRGLIHHYCSKETGQLKSIRLIGLRDQETSFDSNLRFNSVPPYYTPVFDKSVWSHLIDQDEYSFSSPAWPMVSEERQMRLIFNEQDTFLLAYGAMKQEVFLNENISFFFDDEYRLSGFKVFSPEYVPELLRRMGLKITG